MGWTLGASHAQTGLAPTHAITWGQRTAAKQRGPGACQALQSPQAPAWQRAAAGALAAALSLQAAAAPSLAAAAAAEAAAAAAEPAAAAAAPARQPPRLPTAFPPLPPLRLPAYQTATLPSGLRVFLLEDHEVPLVSGTLVMRGGQRASPPDRVGLASIAASVQRAGGSAQHPGAELDAALEAMGASVEAGASAEVGAWGWAAGFDGHRSPLQ